MKKAKIPYTPLSINAPATKAAIIAAKGSVAKYVRDGRMVGSTVCEILNDNYPMSGREKSKFQKVLRQFAKDGYLVLADQPLDAAA